MMINRGATTTPSWAEPRPGADEIQDEVGLVFFVLFLMQKKKKEMVYISFFFFQSCREHWHWTKHCRLLCLFVGFLSPLKQICVYVCILVEPPAVLPPFQSRVEIEREEGFVMVMMMISSSSSLSSI